MRPSPLLFFASSHLNLTTAALLYVIGVAILSRVGTFVHQSLSPSSRLFAAYLAPPNYSFRIDDPLDDVAVVAFLISSLIIARLVSRLRWMAEEASQA